MTPFLKPPITDEDLARLRERNEQRAREAISKLGKRYVLDGANRVHRLHPEPLHRVLRPTSCI